MADQQQVDVTQAAPPSPPPVIDWAKLGANRVAASSQPQQAPVQPVAAQPAGIDWAKLGVNRSSAVARQAAPPDPSDDTPFFLRNVMSMAGGPTVAGLYDKFVKDPALKGKNPSYVKQLSYEVARMAPETADFLLSAGGAGLTLAHLFPATRPYALLADVGLGGMQLARTAASGAQVAKEPSPQNMAQLIKDGVSSAFMLGGGAHGVGELSGDTSIQARAKGFAQQLSDLAPEPDAKPAVRSAARAKQQAVLQQADGPGSPMEAAYKGIYNTPSWTGVPLMAKMVGVPFPTKLQMAADMVGDRATNIAYQQTRAKQFADQMRAEVPDDERDVSKMGHIIQDPDSNGMTPQEIASHYGVSPKAAEWVQKYREENAGDISYMKEAHGSDKLSLQDPQNYLNQAWNFDATNKRFDQMRADSAAGMENDEIAQKHGVNEKAVERATEDPAYRIGPNSEAAQMFSRRSIKDPFLRKRAVARTDAEGNQLLDDNGDPVGPSSYKEAMGDFGWVPRSTDVADIIQYRKNAMVQSAENHRMANTMRDMGALMPAKEAEQRGLNWPKMVDADPLYRAAYAGKVPGGTTKQGIKIPDRVIMRAQPVAVDPDIYQAANTVFGKGLNFTDPNTGGTTALGALEHLRAWGKVTSTMTSLFHNWNVSQQYLGQSLGNISFTKDPVSGEWRGASPSQVLKSSFFMNPDFIEGAKNSIFDVAGKDTPDSPLTVRLKPEAALEAVKHGLSVGTADSETPFVSWLQKLDGSGVIPKAGRLAGTAMAGFNKATFDYYLQSAKLNSYYSILNRELPRLGPDAPEAAIEDLKKTAAQHINRAFGTESLESMLISPKARQALGFALFAPTWAINNVRQLTAGWENATGRPMKVRSLAGGIMAYFLATNLANYATTAWDSKDQSGNHTWQGHFTWDNPGLPARIGGRLYPGISENAGKIYDGRNNDGPGGTPGSQRYLTYGKSATDGFQWFQDPVHTLAGKLSTPVKAAITELTNYAPGSDYKVIKNQAEGATSGEEALQRAATALDPVTPFWAEHFKQQAVRKLAPEVQPDTTSQQNILTGLPASKGVTFEKAKELYIEALEKRDPALIRQVAQVAALNKLNVESIYKAAQQAIAARRRNARGR